MKLLSKLPTRWYIAILIICGLVVRFWWITKASIWHDEGFTMMLAPQSPTEIIARTIRDVHPPLYYLLLHYWLALFGTSELAARSLSTMIMVAAIPLVYLLMKSLWNERAARTAALLVTFGPFLIRYSQEARMYGMLAVLSLAATYVLIRAWQSNNYAWWLGYAVIMTASLYTHYYTVFVIVVHWIYATAITKRSTKAGLFSNRWWWTNALIAALFLPWIPIALAQFSRVQVSFWIPANTLATLPDTMFQFLIFKNDNFMPVGLKLLAACLFLASIYYAYHKMRGKRHAIVLLTSYCLVGPLAVFLLSFKQPLFVDRYFVFAGIAFACLLAIFAELMPRRVRIGFIGILLVGCGYGVINIHQLDRHHMDQVASYIQQRYEPGDFILSGEIYTFFDYNYYNKTGAQTHLWSREGVNGYSESSLIYDRADEIVVKNLEDIQPPSGKVWVVGKPYHTEYYEQVPPTWHKLGSRFEVADSSVQLFLVEPRSTQKFAVQYP